MNSEADALARILAAQEQGQSAGLNSALSHPSTRVRQAAILALGQTGDTSHLGELAALLNKKRSPHRADIAFALGLIPHDDALTIAMQHLAMQKDPEVLAELFKSIGRSGSEKHLPVLARALQSQGHPEVLNGICEAIGILWAKDSESWAVPSGLITGLIQRAQQMDALAASCTFALSRFKGLPSHIPPQQTLGLAASLRASESTIFVIKTLARIHTPESTQYLLQKSAPFTVQDQRVEAIKALGQHPPSKLALSVLRQALTAPAPAVVYVALEALRTFGPQAQELALPTLQIYRKSASTWVRAAALRTAMAIDPTAARPAVLVEINNPASPLRPAAAGALANHANATDAGLVATLAQDNHPGVALETLEALAAWPEQGFTPELRAALKKTVGQKDPALISTIATLVERFRWSEFVDPLQQALTVLQQPDLLDARLAVQYALEALGVGTGQNDRAPADITPKQLSITADEIRTAMSARVALKTTRGEIHLKFLQEAPMNAAHFIRLVRKGFYNGLAFHRVVPGFVAQGGDPRNDGYGGPGYFVRDELSRRSHERGTVGVATSARDTGGSQFFINLGYNRHLNGRYTAFAEITQGMDIADRIEGGDKIIQARILP